MVNFTTGPKGLDGENIEVPKFDMGLTVEERIALAEKLERNNHHTNGDHLIEYANRRKAVSLLRGVGAMGILAGNNAKIIQIGGDWRERVNDSEIVSLVKEGTAIQEEAMSTTSSIVMDEKYWKARPKIESTVEKENKVKAATSFSELFTIIDALGVSGDIDAEKTKTFIGEYRKEGKEGYRIASTKKFGLRDKVTELYFKEKASLQENNLNESLEADREKENKVKAATSFSELFTIIDALGVSGDIDAEKTKTFIGEYRKEGKEGYRIASTKKFGLRDKVTELYFKEKALSTEGKPAVDEKGFIEAIENGVNMEKAEEVIEKRKKGVFGRLGDMGLKVARGYQTMKPRNKLMLGVFFAGISVATGGTASIVPKMFAAGSFGVGFYDKILKAEEEKGNEVNKTALKIRSALYGTVMAMGTSMLFAEVASHVHVDTEGLMNSAQEKVSAMKEGLKNLFGFSSEAVQSVPTDVVAPFNPDAPVVDIPSPDAPVVPESVTVEAPTFPTSYTFVPGENLTKVISEQVLAKLPETAGINNGSLIQNLLNLAADNPSDPAYATLNQFTNPNVVHTGDRLNLQAIKELISKPMKDFGGQSLIEHARKIASLAK